MTEELYDEKLSTIKAFHTYLSEVINKGYNNSYVTLSYIVKHINNFQDEIIEERANNNIIETSFVDEENMNECYDNQDIYYSAQSFKLSSNSSSTSSSTSSSSSSSSSSSTNSDTDDDVNEERQLKQQREKELAKINKFIDGPDLSKIYLYKKNDEYIKNMMNFIKNSYNY